MQNVQDLEVAVLLATYNGAQFLEQQIRSLKNNSTSYTLHWLDDHSTDISREIVRSVAKTEGIQLREWHQPEHQGVPGAFFCLLECVDADIYLFCDQDDLWQPGKIDATVANLRPDISVPVLCCTDSLLFRDNDPETFYRFSYVARAKPEQCLQESRLFMSLFVNGHTQGFTRPLRDAYVRHKDIARAYACMHDEWMHAIAIASGGVRVLSNSPTTLYRWHRNNASGAYGGWAGKGRGYLTATTHELQNVRLALARHAQGFILASETLPPGPKLERLVAVARLVASVHKRQSLPSIIRLVKKGIIWPSRRLAFVLAAACLCSNA